MEVADYLAPRIASLAAFATRNLTTFLAGILMVSPVAGLRPDRKSTRLNSSHRCISYAVFCLKKKKESNNKNETTMPSPEPKYDLRRSRDRYIHAQCIP